MLTLELVSMWRGKTAGDFINGRYNILPAQENAKGLPHKAAITVPPGERLTATITAANETGGANEDMQSHECVADGWRRNVRGQCDCAAVPFKIDPHDRAVCRRRSVRTR